MSKLEQLIIDFHQTLHKKLVKGEFVDGFAVRQLG